MGGQNAAENPSWAAAGGGSVAQGGVMKILFTFPGQGTQHPGMLQSLPGTELAQAREVLGAEVDALDTPQALEHTRAVQLALLISGVACARELQRRGMIADIASGLSIGAFPAAVVAGALDFHGCPEAGGAARRPNGTGLAARVRPDGNYGADPASRGRR